MSPVTAECHADQPPEYQLMQMQGVRLVDRYTTLEAPAPDGEHGFEYWIEQYGKRIEWRHAGVAHHQLNGQLRKHETQEIGPTITQEYPPEGEVPDKKAQGGRCQRGGNEEDGNILNLQGNQRKGQRHERGNHACQAVHA